MTNLFVFTQNVKLESILKYAELSVSSADKTVFLTTHFLFENERAFLNAHFGNCEFRTFADYLTDEEMANCDIESFVSKDMDYNLYIDIVPEGMVA